MPPVTVERVVRLEVVKEEIEWPRIRLPPPKPLESKLICSLPTKVSATGQFSGAPIEEAQTTIDHGLRRHSLPDLMERVVPPTKSHQLADLRIVDEASRVVAVLLESLGYRRNSIVEAGLVHNTMLRGVDPGEHRSVSRGRPDRRRERIPEQNRLLGKTVQKGRRRSVVSVAGHVIGPQRIDRDEDDIRIGFHYRESNYQARGKAGTR